MTSPAEGRPRFVDLLRVRPFVVLCVAELLSTVGDQLARLALAELVFERTHSAADAAIIFTASLLPAILGGAVLGRLGDKFPRRVVMIATDLFRMAIFVLMAVPGQPIGVVIGMLVVSAFVGPAFMAAEVSFLAAALSSEQFRAATALRTVMNQLAQVAGYGFGGLVVVAVAPRGALLVDAGTFLLSAALVTVGLHGMGGVAARTPTVARSRQGGPGVQFAGVWRDPRTRVFMAFTILIGLFVLPEGLSVPFGREIGAGTTQTGLLVASLPLGSAVGAALVLRTPAQRRRRVAGWMAVACGLPLTVCAVQPAWPVACLCWFVSGVFAAYQVEATTVLVNAIPDEVRSRVLGFVSAWLLGAQGVGWAAGGGLARITNSGTAIACGAGLGSAIALVLVLGPLRTPPPPTGVRPVG